MWWYACEEILKAWTASGLMDDCTCGAHLGKAERDVASLRRCLRGLESLSQLAGEAVQLPFLSNETQQVLHDGPEILSREVGLR